MRIKHIAVIITLNFMTSCFNVFDIKSFKSSFYPVEKTKYDWINNEFFKDKPISIQLKSHIDHNGIWQEFEPINLETANLYLDRDVFIFNDTIKKFSNLLNTDHAEIELIEAMLNGKPYGDSYIVWINKSNIIDYQRNKGYLTIYFSVSTENNYSIKDSTVIQIQ